MKGDFMLLSLSSLAENESKKSSSLYKEILSKFVLPRIDRFQIKKFRKGKKTIRNSPGSFSYLQCYRLFLQAKENPHTSTWIGNGSLRLSSLLRRNLLDHTCSKEGESLVHYTIKFTKHNLGKFSLFMPAKTCVKTYQIGMHNQHDWLQSVLTQK